MALITPPAAFAIRRIAWKLKQPTQVNRSGWSGRRQALVLPGGALWTAQVELLQIRGEIAARAWRSFFARCRGRFNMFQLPATEGPQHALANTIRVNGGGQSGRVLSTKGWPSSTTVLRDGSFIAVTTTGQLLTVIGDVITNGSGIAVIDVEPALRISPADNAIVETKIPAALVGLSSDEVEWAVDVGQFYNFKPFDVEEVF